MLALRASCLHPVSSGFCSHSEPNHNDFVCALIQCGSTLCPPPPCFFAPYCYFKAMTVCSKYYVIFINIFIMLIFLHYSRVVWSYNHKTSRSVWPTINVKETVVAAQRSHVSGSWSPGLGLCIFTEALSILHCCSTMRSFSSVHRFLCRFGSAGQVGHSLTPLTCCSFGLCFVDVQEEPPELVALMLDLIPTLC